MNKENYKRPVGGGLGQVHLDGEGWEVHIPYSHDPHVYSNCELIVKEREGRFLVSLETTDESVESFFAPGLLLDLAIAIVKKAKKDGIDVDRW